MTGTPDLAQYLARLAGLHPRICPQAFAPAEDRWHAQLCGYQVMPAEEILRSRWAALSVPSNVLLGRPGVRVTCSTCGEEVLNDRQVVTAGGPLCGGCLSRSRDAPDSAPGPGIRTLVRSADLDRLADQDRPCNKRASQHSFTPGSLSPVIDSIDGWRYQS